MNNSIERIRLIKNNVYNFIYYNFIKKCNPIQKKKNYHLALYR